MDAYFAILVLNIIGVVALIAYVTRSRALFVAGSIGSLLGYVVPPSPFSVDGTPEQQLLGLISMNVVPWGRSSPALSFLA